MPALQLTNDRVKVVVKSLPWLLVHGENADEAIEFDCSPYDLLKDYFRVIEIAHFVRRGGVPAMLYRLETGKTKFSPSDYLDEAHAQLLSTYQDIYKPDPHTEESLLDLLRSVTPEEEAAVSAELAHLDSYMLAEKRKQSAEFEKP